MLTGSFNIITATLIVLTVACTSACILFGVDPVGTVAACLTGLYLSGSPRMVNEWERGVMLRLGKFRDVLEPGVTWILPGFDAIASKVDMRIRSTSFSAEKTLTRDTVPVNVDAVLFWVVTDAKKSVLEVERFRQTVSWAAQTTLRDVIGKSELVRMISDRESLDLELQKIIDTKTSEWGITVQSVEIRDVILPAALEDAMSRKAQADREKEARVILAESEQKVAEEMQKASNIYQQSPSAMQLRAMNMTYEAVKERGALMVVPSGMVEAGGGNAILGQAATAFKFEDGQAT